MQNLRKLDRLSPRSKRRMGFSPSKHQRHFLHQPKPRIDIMALWSFGINEPSGDDGLEIDA